MEFHRPDLSRLMFWRKPRSSSEALKRLEQFTAPIDERRAQIEANQTGIRKTLNSAAASQEQARQANRFADRGGTTGTAGRQIASVPFGHK